MSNLYSFSKEELDFLTDMYQLHLKECGGNTGREKMPKHWIKLTMFSPPRAGRFYKGINCNCGWEFYLPDGTEETIKSDVAR